MRLFNKVKMKFINTNALNRILEDFKRCGNNGDFQAFAEETRLEGKPVCIDTEPVRELLEKSYEDDYKYLIKCEAEDLRYFGLNYLTRINFFRVLLGTKEDFTIEDIKNDRKSNRVGFELIELKTDGSHYEFIIKDTIKNRIIGWQSIPGSDVFMEYLKEHLFPKDKLC